MCFKRTISTPPPFTCVNVKRYQLWFFYDNVSKHIRKRVVCSRIRATHLHVHVLDTNRETVDDIFISTSEIERVHFYSTGILYKLLITVF